jgi:hypothetical protein
MDMIRTQNVNIPRLGFGTFRMPGDDCQPVVESALARDYRKAIEIITDLLGSPSKPLACIGVEGACEARAP